jgi:2-oxo-3-hexenedioate decarboxylase
VTSPDSIADRLVDGISSRSTVTRPSEEAELSLEDAYRVQRLVVDRLLQQGSAPAGLKLGFTSEAKAAQMGVREVILGQLTSAMEIADGATVALDRFIHPRVEPEVAFLLDGSSADDGTAPTVLAAAPAIEIIDSRYDGFRFSLGDVVADNASSAGFVLGQWKAIPPEGLRNRGVVLRIGGRVRQAGSTAAILGDPVRGVAKATTICRAHGIDIGQVRILLAGAATEAIAIDDEEDVLAQVDGLGPVAVRFKRS